MGQKDLTEKSLEFYPDVFADIVNTLLYRGERVLLPENLQAAPTETIYQDGQGLLHNQFHDVSKYEIENGEIGLQYTLENETIVNPKMLLRKAGYEGAVYRGQYDGPASYPFVSVVLFWGKGRWNGPKSIHQMFPREDQLNKYIDNIRLHVYEMAHLPKKVRERFQSDMRIVVDYLAKGKDYVPTKQRIVHLEALLLMLCALTGDAKYEEILPEMQAEEKRMGGISMCELLDKYENKGKEAGIKLGKECVNKLIKQLIADGRSDDIARMATDWEFQNRLLAEYGL